MNSSSDESNPSLVDVGTTLGLPCSVEEEDTITMERWLVSVMAVM
jgi:hypothetical protein